MPFKWKYCMDATVFHSSVQYSAWRWHYINIIWRCDHAWIHAWFWCKTSCINEVFFVAVYGRSQGLPVLKYRRRRGSKEKTVSCVLHRKCRGDLQELFHSIWIMRHLLHLCSLDLVFMWSCCLHIKVAWDGSSSVNIER